MQEREGYAAPAPPPGAATLPTAATPRSGSVPRPKTVLTYGVIIHQTGEAWNAYVPELKGAVVAAATSRARVLELIAEAIKVHTQGDSTLGVSEGLTLVLS